MHERGIRFVLLIMSKTYALLYNCRHFERRVMATKKKYVTLIISKGHETDDSESIGGFENDLEDVLNEYADEGYELDKLTMDVDEGTMLAVVIMKLNMAS